MATSILSSRISRPSVNYSSEELSPVVQRRKRAFEENQALVAQSRQQSQSQIPLYTPQKRFKDTLGSSRVSLLERSGDGVETIRKLSETIQTRPEISQDHSFDVLNRLVQRIIQTPESLTTVRRDQLLREVGQYQEETNPMFTFDMGDRFIVDTILQTYEIMSYAYILKPVETSSPTLLLQPKDYTVDIYALVHTVGFVLENGLYRDTGVSKEIMDAIIVFLEFYDPSLAFYSFQHRFIDVAYMYIKSILSTSFGLKANAFYIQKLGNSIPIVFYRMLTTFTLMHKFKSDSVPKYFELLQDTNIQIDVYNIHSNFNIIKEDNEYSSEYIQKLAETTIDAVRALGIRPLLDECLETIYSIMNDEENMMDMDNNEEFINESVNALLDFTGRFMENIQRLGDYFPLSG